MPTSNPVPSYDPSDLIFNAEKLDETVNSASLTFTDRLGAPRKTMAGIQAAFDAQLADAESDLNVYRADAAASAAEALGYLQTYRATSYGALASDPATDPLGNPPTVGDEYFNTTSNLLKRFNGTTWQASDINTANLAAPSGSSLVGFDGETVQGVLDNAKAMQSYTALRNYTGRATGVRITTPGVHGFFQRRGTSGLTDNGGTVIIDGAGRSWERIFSGNINLLWFGADWTGASDSTSAFNSAVSATPEGGTLDIPDGVFYIAGTASITKNINIVCNGRILLAADNAAYISFSQVASFISPGSALSALPKKGDSQLTWTTSPSLDNPSDYFFSLISTEDEIARIGQAYYTPYTKNESNAVITELYYLRAGINLTYTDASKLNIYFFKKRRPVSVTGLNVSVVPTSGVTNKNDVIKLFGVSNVTFENLVIDRLNTNWTGSNFSMTNCHGLRFKNCQIKGSNNSGGDSYPFVASISSFLHFEDCEYVDGNGFTKRERGYAARHGNYVFFYNCRFAGIDDHYGHNYFIQNCVFNLRGVSVSGGSVTIKDSKIFGSTYLFSQRSDAPYSDGTLHIENCEADSRLVTSYRDPDARSTKRKFFDRIRIVNCRIVNTTFIDAAIKISQFLSTDTLYKTTKLEVINVTHVRGINSSYCSLYEGSTAASVDGGTLYRWVESAEFINCDMSLKNYVDGGFSTTYIPVRSLNADSARFVNCAGLITYGCDLGKAKFVDCSLSYSTYNFEMYFSPTCGEITFDNCDIGALINPDASSTTMRFVLKNNLFTYKYLLATGGAASRLASRITYMSRNRALTDADLSGAPTTIEYYINPTYYKTA
jgi:uncharacterized protein YjbI with pentapeptide repeats